MSKKIVFKELVSIEEAVNILRNVYKPSPPPIREVPIKHAYGKVLAEDIISDIDVPPYTRSIRDGYAVRYEDVIEAREDNPIKLRVVGSLEAGSNERLSISSGEAIKISTGAPIPSGANSVVMDEYVVQQGEYIYVYKKSRPGEWIQFAGSDVRRGEIVYHAGTILGSRELGVIGGLGVDKIKIYDARPASYISTGDELRRPGEELKYGSLYDVNLYSITSLLEEDGLKVTDLGIARDNIESFYNKINKGLRDSEIVVLSGSTSVGGKDLLFEAISLFKDAKILFYGIKIKPGKPTIAAMIGDKLIIGLPGFPVSALMIYLKIFSDVIRDVNMLPPRKFTSLEASSGYYFRSIIGVRQLYPVYLKRIGSKIYFYPIKTESGAIATLSHSDGFIEIPEDTLYVNKGDIYTVNLFGGYIRPSDIINLTSHSIALDKILSLFRRRYRYMIKSIYVGSTGALIGVREGYNDFGGIHLRDEKGNYNIRYLEDYNVENAVLYHGFYRRIGFIVRRGNPKKIKSFKDLIRDDIKFINRIGGSGIRVYIEHMIKRLSNDLGIDVDEIRNKINGYTVEAKTHSAIVNAVESGLYDVGIATELSTVGSQVDFIPLDWERYDFLFNKESIESKAINDLIEFLKSDEVKELLNNLRGIKVDSNYMKILFD